MSQNGPGPSIPQFRPDPAFTTLHNFHKVSMYLPLVLKHSQPWPAGKSPRYLFSSVIFPWLQCPLNCRGLPTKNSLPCFMFCLMTPEGVKPCCLKQTLSLESPALLVFLPAFYLPFTVHKTWFRRAYIIPSSHHPIISSFHHPIMALWLTIISPEVSQHSHIVLPWYFPHIFPAWKAQITIPWLAAALPVVDKNRGTPRSHPF